MDTYSVLYKIKGIEYKQRVTVHANSAEEIREKFTKAPFIDCEILNMELLY